MYMIAYFHTQMGEGGKGKRKEKRKETEQNIKFEKVVFSSNTALFCTFRFKNNL
jgi:hypothetical protein